MFELQHPEIEELMFFKDCVSGNVMSCAKSEPTNPAGHFVVFGPRVTVDSRLFNLLAASPMMYQTLTEQYGAIQKLLEVIDRLPRTKELAALAASFGDMQDAMLLAQRVAQVGIEEVAKSLDANSKRS